MRVTWGEQTYNWKIASGVHAVHTHALDILSFAIHHKLNHYQPALPEVLFEGLFEQNNLIMHRHFIMQYLYRCVWQNDAMMPMNEAYPSIHAQDRQDGSALPSKSSKNTSEWPGQSEELLHAFRSAAGQVASWRPVVRSWRKFPM